MFNKKRQIYHLIIGFLIIIIFILGGLLLSRTTKKEPLLIIAPSRCRVCNTEKAVNYLKTQFPDLTVSYLYYPQAAAKRMIKYFGIKALPAYFLSKEIEKEKSFENLKNNLEAKGDFYLLKPKVSGFSYFIDRKKIKGKFDLFISLYDKNAAGILPVVKEFNPAIHFLAVQQQDNFDAARGNIEVEECLRAVCAQKYYPEKFWDYIKCRAKNINSSEWQVCASDFNIDKIKACVSSQEGKELLRGNISLNKELQIMFGPAYLLENQEIFATQGVPTKEELRKLIKR